ncbi:MAG: NAD(+) diphosphatase [Gammaproteobacteria bacterium]|mgnify:FL=1|jgi:NAD+ diphosphatase|nr:NAD(+) diphosphatase [Gammaproteobacteria bacterium]MBT5203706.1 NAD(+) diphosphatase [Gammaproteobacteria bacterium]MBT5601697.1 NAD(+) diphosphatase [Gammaproteobacteria bacterium]MBT6245240.1 NAD(+) diphosphatase [Gammaproteobacteria bacterium]
MIWPEANIGFSSPLRVHGEALENWFFVFFADSIVVRRDASSNFRAIGDAELKALAVDEEGRFFMGMQGSTACYAVNLSTEPDQEMSTLRDLFGSISVDLFNLAGRALQTLDWDRTHRFCGKCGGQMRVSESDRSSRCDTCQLSFYARISPSIIVLVHHDRKVLLARNHRFPIGLFSTLAGFVEPGESVEGTLSREVREEVGVEISDFRYCCSQPWPFPNSLMLGFQARYNGGEIRLQEEEIAEAAWFDIEALPVIPGKHAISRWLIDDYLRQQGVWLS